MIRKSSLAIGCAVLICGAASAAALQHPAMPPGMTHEEHLAQMQKEREGKERAAASMGFDPDRTSHHFRLTHEGGAIEVNVNDASDLDSLAQVRGHLQLIAAEFADGNFEKPFATHGEMPPGVETMRRRRSAISYSFEPTDVGGRVRISTGDDEARAAIHEFLRYQIREHKTGDSLSIPQQRPPSR